MSAHISDRPWRFSYVEKKIMQCTALGEPADFSDEKARGEQPTVTGQFLADLWSGRHDGHTFDPFGIEIKGLRILGKLRARNNPFREGYDRLARFKAIDCEFSNSIQASHNKLSSIELEDCKVGLDKERLQYDFDCSIALDGCDVSNGFILTNTDCSALVSLTNASLGGSGIHIDRSRLVGTLFLTGVQARQLYCYKSHFKGRALLDEDPTFSILAQSAHFDEQVLIFNCKLLESSSFWLASTNRFELNRCDFAKGEDVSVNAEGLTAGHIRLMRCRFRGPFAANEANVSRGVGIAQCQFGGHPNLSSLELTGIKIGHNLTLMHCMVSHGLALEDSDLQGPLIITCSRLNGSEFTENFHRVCLCGRGASINSAVFHNSQFSGAVAFNNCGIEGDFRVLSSRFMPMETRNITDLVEGLEADGELIGHFRLGFDGAELGKGISIADSILVGSVTFNNASMKSFEAFHTILTCPIESTSLTLVGVEGPVDFGLAACAISSGLDLSRGVFKAIGIGGCDIGPSASQANNEWAIGSDDIECKTNFRIVEWEGYRTHIRGRVYIRNSTIGSTFTIGGATFELTSGNIEDGWGCSLSLSATKFEDDVAIGPTFANYTSEACAETSKPVFEGAISFVDASIESTLSIHATTIVADGEIQRPMSHFASQERVKHRLRGVAVSLRRAQISGEFMLGEPNLSGLLDLRDAQIRLINDGGGTRWSKAGIDPGHLLLDGLVYKDLDDVDEGKELSRQTKSDMISRRLDWLALQYPDRVPTDETFVPQPYEQLASLFAAEGDERSRRRVQISRRDLQRQHGGLKPIERSIQWLLKTTCEYGYSPTRAIAFVLSYLGFGAVIAEALDSKNAMMLASVDAAAETAFNPIIYALDSAIPIIDLNQDGVWTINPSVFDYDWALQAMVFGKGLYEVFGMLLISITILTLTGTLRDKE